MPKKTSVKKTATKTRRTPARRVAKKPAVAEKKPVMKKIERVVEKKPQMVGPLTAVKNFWVRYFDFMGRSTRAEFWFGFIFAVAVNWIFMRFIGGITATVVNAVLFIPLMALTVRRFRDAGLSVWLYLVPALVVYILPLIYGGEWYHLIEFGQISLGMLLYTLFFVVFGVLQLVVACLPTRR